MIRLARNSRTRMARMEQLTFAIFQTDPLPSFSREQPRGFPLLTGSTARFDVWRHIDLDRGLVELRVWRTQQDTNTPVTSHRERPLRTISTKPGWLHGDLIGPHIHLEHRGRKLRLQTGGRRSTASILHLHCEGIEAKPVRCHAELDCKALINRLHGCMKRRRLRRCLSSRS